VAEGKESYCRVPWRQTGGEVRARVRAAGKALDGDDRQTDKQTDLRIGSS